jgi:protein CpxP
MKMITFRKYATRLGALALCSAALCTTPMLAQGGGGRGMQTPDQQVAALDTAVTLTPDQKPKVLAIFTADAKKMADLRAAQDPDMRTKMTAMRADEQSQIKAVLTDDQKTKYDAMIAARGAGRQGGGGGAAPPQD